MRRSPDRRSYTPRLCPSGWVRDFGADMHRLVFLLSFAVTAGLPLAQTPVPIAQRPNVVLIITDDVGYGDFSSYGAPDIRTPNIDGLAKDGVRLTDFYANGATCSPTRTGLISGRYQQR